MRKTGIYTKSGDTGFASTINRRMIPKNAPIFALLGTLDELNSALGLARSRLPEETKAIVQAMQEDLIKFSGELAGGERFVNESQVAGMEKSIDLMMQSVGQFSGFVTPGKSEAGAALDLARTVARRAERELVANQQTGGVAREAMAYLNRLSDLIYALARLTDVQTGTGSPARAAVSERAELLPESRPLSGAAKAVPEGEDFLSLALWLCREVQQKSRELPLAVVTTVCDAGGNTAALMRADNALLASVEIAQNKAYTGLAVQMSTAELAKISQPGGPFYGVQNQSRMVIFGGGIPLFRAGVLIGGFGVSGGSTAQDTGLAEYAQQIFDRQYN